MPDLCRVDARENAWRVAGDHRLCALPARQVFDLPDDPRQIKRREIVLWLLDRDQRQGGQWDAVRLEADSTGICGDSRFDIEDGGRHGEMEKRALAVAEIVETALATSFVGMKDDLDLADEFPKPQIERSKERGRIGAGTVHLLPPLFDRCGHEIDGSLSAERPVQGGPGFGEDVSHLLRPIDGPPKPTAQERRHLRNAITRRGNVNHLNASAVDRFQLDAVVLGEIAECSDRPEFLFDGAVKGAVFSPSRLQA